MTTYTLKNDKNSYSFCQAISDYFSYVNGLGKFYSYENCKLMYNIKDKNVVNAILTDQLVFDRNRVWICVHDLANSQTYQTRRSDGDRNEIHIVMFENNHFELLISKYPHQREVPSAYTSVKLDTLVNEEDGVEEDNGVVKDNGVVEDNGVENKNDLYDAVNVEFSEVLSKMCIAIKTLPKGGDHYAITIAAKRMICDVLLGNIMEVQELVDR